MAATFDFNTSSSSSSSSPEVEQSVKDKTFEEKKKWEKPYQLPPCKVCEGKGTGFHYGVNTCEPCKVFFKRSLTKHQDYRCREDIRCRIKDGRRNMCAYCRYLKCMKVGMSLEGIRNGRYTLTKKNRDIMTVKEMQVQQALAVRLVKEEQFRPSVEKLVVTMAGARGKLVDQWINCEHDSRKMLDTYLQNFGIQDNMTADLMNLEKGDKRVEFWNTALKQGERTVRLSLKFAKLVPGFRELDMDDQVSLFQGVFKDLYQACVLGVYLDEELSEWAKTLDFEALAGEEGGRMGRRFTKYCQSLHATEEELALFSAMVIFQSDRCTLKNPRRVDELQHQMATALHWLVKRNHPDDKHLFHRMISALTMWRSFEKYMESLVVGMMNLEAKGVIEIPLLVKEVSPPLQM